MSSKKLHKSNNKKICGVCGGIAEYFNIDPTIVRIIAAILFVFGVGSPVLIYLILAFILPNADDSNETQYTYANESDKKLKDAKIDHE